MKAYIDQITSSPLTPIELKAVNEQDENKKHAKSSLTESIEAFSVLILNHYDDFKTMVK